MVKSPLLIKRLNTMIMKGLKKDRYVFPAILSTYLPGFGQLIKGDWKSFFKHVLGYLFLFTLLFSSLMFQHEGSFILFIISLAVFWIWSIRDAYLG